jgi:hypothetical protein
VSLKETYLPALAASSRAGAKSGNTIVTEQTSFGGLRHRPDAGATDVFDMKNLTPSAHALTVRPERRTVIEAFEGGGAPHGMCNHYGLIVAQGTSLYRISDGEVVRLADVSDTDKSFASFGEKLIITPDKLCYDAATGEVHPIELDSGKFGGTVSGNQIVGSGTWEEMGFHVGDGVRIEVGMISSDGHTGPEVVYCHIKSFWGRAMYVDREFTQKGQQNIRMVRECPDMTHVCACGERLVGCKGNVIHISEAGNPYNWCATDPDGVASHDPATVRTASAGNFTGCIPWEGYVLLFKEDHVCRLIGHGAGSYAVDDAPFVGVSDARSLCLVNGDVYYLGSTGPYRYGGSTPTGIGDDIGVHLTEGCGGTDGRYYYLSAKDTDGGEHIYVWDPAQSSWYIEDSADVAFMANVGDRLYFQTSAGSIVAEGNAYHPTGDGVSEIDAVGMIEASVTFGGDQVSLPTPRRLKGLRLVAEAEIGAEMTVLISYDGGAWQRIGSMEGAGVRRTYRIDLVPCACDEYSLRLQLSGGWRIDKIYRVYRE